MSAITLLGTPVEMYQYSTVYVYIGIGYFLVMAAAAHIYIPIFFRLKITSSFEVGQSCCYLPYSSIGMLVLYLSIHSY